MALHFMLWLVVGALFFTNELVETKPSNTGDGFEVIDPRRESRIPGSKTRFYVCPPEFIRLGNKCYLLSHSIGTWQEAHFDCQDRKAELAIVDKAWEDRHLRKYLHKPELARLERWIGGIYDWQQMTWTWGGSGRRIEYNGFYRLKQNASSEDLKWQCAIIDPQLKFKWNYRSCVAQKHYICQTDLQKMTKKQQNKYEKHFSHNGINARLNQIPVPDQFSDPAAMDLKKPRPQRVRPNQHNFKIHQPRVHPNYIQTRNDNAIAQYAHRNRSNDLTVRRKTGRQQRIRNRCRNRDKYVDRQVDPHVSEDECVRILNENWRKKNRVRKQRRNKENLVQSSSSSSLENITPKTYVFYPRISELHPQAITEIHDF